MSEPESQGDHTHNWAPPTGAPAPRPDPYAQYGNPLHDTWGSSHTHTPAEPQTTGAHKMTRDGSHLKPAIVVAALVVLAVLGWLARDTLVDAWDRVYDKVADVSGDDGTGGAGSSSSAPTTASVDDRMAEIEAVRDEAFDDWMRDQRKELSAAMERVASAEDEMVQLDQVLDAGGTVDLDEYRAAMVESRDATVAAAEILDDGPESVMRTDFLTVLLLQAGEAGKMVAAADAQDTSAARAASQHLARVRAETTRLCRQHGRKAGVLCD